MSKLKQFKTHLFNRLTPKIFFHAWSRIPFRFFFVIGILCSGLFFNIQNDEATASSLKKVTFPKDHLEHRHFDAEWWYLNMSVIAKDKKTGAVKNFAYIIFMSRINGQYAILSSKYDNSDKGYIEKTEVGGSINTSVRNKRINISYKKNEKYKMRLSEFERKKNGIRSYKLSGNTPQVGNFNLNLTERSYSKYNNTQPLLWGCNGVISVFEPDDTFYYSIPELNISGQITEGSGSGKKIYNVMSGKTWIDHQWFNAPSMISPRSFWRGHYWAAFHYSKGKNPLSPTGTGALGTVVQVFSDGPKYSYWVKRNFNGKNECGSKATIKAFEHGSNGYPQKFNITLLKQSSNKPFAKIQSTVFSSNQVTRPPLGPEFLEASSYFKGTIDNSKVYGVGIIETHLK